MCDGYLCVDENGDGVSPSLDDECVCLCSSERLGPGSSDVRRLGGAEAVSDAFLRKRPLEFQLVDRQLAHPLVRV